MSKKLPKKGQPQKKMAFDIETFKKDNGLDLVIKEKPESYLPFHEAFHEAVGIPGPPRGYVTLFRGFSDTGKSTAIYESIVGAQKIGDFPVIIDTEGNFNWEHAKLIGMEFEDVYGEVVDEETGEIKTEVVNHKGNFLFFNGKHLLDRYRNFDYSDGKEKSKSLRGEPVVEDVAKLMNDLLTLQDEEKLPYNLVFLWDSIGSVGCFKGATSGSNNNMWVAGAIASAFNSLLNFRIPTSRNEDSPYTNTFIGVQKVWLDSQGGGMPTVKHKGGEAFKFGARIIVHMGGKLGSGSVRKKATAGGNEYMIGSEVKIEVSKNHVNGIEKFGKILSTPHGFVNPDKFEEYKKEHKDFILAKLNTELSDFSVEDEDIDVTEE